MWPVGINLAYWNVKHDPIRFDFSKFRFDFTKMKSDYKDVVFIEMPLIEYWKVGFDYEWRQKIFHDSGHVDFTFNNTSAIVALTLAATEKGHFYPQIHDIKMNYTQTDMEVSGFILKRIYYNQWFKILKAVSQAAINRFGKSVYNRQLPEYFRRFSNGQHYKFKLDYP